MKIQPIEFPLNIGTANELRTYIREDLETENSVVTYYSLIDTDQVQELPSGQQVPYRPLHINKILIEGEDFTSHKQDPNFLINHVASYLGVTLIEE